MGTGESVGMEQRRWWRNQVGRRLTSVYRPPPLPGAGGLFSTVPRVSPPLLATDPADMLGRT